MRLFLSFGILGCLIAITGCSVKIDPTNAIARVATSMEVQQDPEASSLHPDGVGTWVMLTAQIDREDVQRVAFWEVYPHVYIVECSSGRETNVGTEPRLEAIDFANANSAKMLLKEHPTKGVFQMRSLIFARKGDFKVPQCLQFQGGSYTAQKIVQARIPIRHVGQLP
jgi:hypothetical protein